MFEPTAASGPPDGGVRAAGPGADALGGDDMTGRAAPSLVWSALARRMGYIRDAPQREEILAARTRMIWCRGGGSGPTGLLVGATVRTMLGTNHAGPCQRLQRVGVAELTGGRRLVGVESDEGQRYYLLDLNGEAVHVLTDMPAPGHAQT